MSYRYMIYGAQFLSLLFNPFYLPLLGLIILFTVSALSMMPVMYKLSVLTIVFVFTVLLPMALIRVYRFARGLAPGQIGRRTERTVPYVISIVCYFTCVYIMSALHIPHFMGSLLTGALCIQIICAVINVWWKISTHTAATGGVAGALFAFSYIFGFNPTGWLCVVFLVAGLLGSCRMILRQHSLSQVIVGFVVGCVCIFTILII